MALGNSPKSDTTLRLEARKSFSFGLFFTDKADRVLNISDAELFIVMRPSTRLAKQADEQDQLNLISNSSAEIVNGEKGYAVFNLQAYDLDHAPGEYDYSIVMRTEGYSAVIVRGVIQLINNTEFSSISETYDLSQGQSNLKVQLGGKHVIKVETGPTLAPGTVSFTVDDQKKLEGIEAGAQVNESPSWIAGPDEPGFIQHKPELGNAAFVDVEDFALPRGGYPGEVLVKLSGNDWDTKWSNLPNTGNPNSDALGAVDVPAGHVPTADGVDGWSWAAPDAGVTTVNGQSGDVTLSLDDIPDTGTRVAITPAERDKLEALPEIITWDLITDPPNFGTAALLDEEEVLKPLEVDGADITSGIVDPDFLPRVFEHRGISAGTGLPSGGMDGDIYFQYT